MAELVIEIPDGLDQGQKDDLRQVMAAFAHHVLTVAEAEPGLAFREALEHAAAETGFRQELRCILA